MKTLKSIAYILAISVCMYLITHKNCAIIGFCLILSIGLQLSLNLLRLHFKK